MTSFLFQLKKLFLGANRLRSTAGIESLTNLEVLSIPGKYKHLDSISVTKL